MGREDPFWADYLTPAQMSQNTENSVSAQEDNAAVPESTVTQPDYTQPQNTAAPVNYAQPQNTAAPVNYAQPQNTATPVNYAQPQNTATPVNYAQPQNTAAPVNYAQPQNTAAPVNYAQPQNTAAPVNYAQPQNTAAPVNYAQPQNTAAPVNYAQPQNMAAPVNYAQYQNGTASGYGAVPPTGTAPNGSGNSGSAAPKKDRTAYIILFALLGLVVVLTVIVVVFLIQRRNIAVDDLQQGYTADYFDDSSDDDSDTDTGLDGDDTGSGQDDSDSASDDSNLPTDDELDDMLQGTQAEGEEYYSMDNYIVDDLDYTISFDSYEYSSDNGNIQVVIQYPVFEGDVANSDEIASEVRSEADYWIEFLEETYLSTVDSQSDQLQLYIKPYVTYMSEDILSIAYSENISTASYNSVQIVSVNIDMSTGFKLQNNKILAPDEDFAQGMIDKSDVQNGSSALDDLGADGVLELLEDENSLIIFYTPLGLEVGVNHYNGWTTVTYTDYEQYLNSF